MHIIFCIQIVSIKSFVYEDLFSIFCHTIFYIFETNFSHNLSSRSNARAKTIQLIPKVVGPRLISQFRPISLCNTIYKMVTKILVDRLRPILTKIISPCQVSFLQGRISPIIQLLLKSFTLSGQRKEKKASQLGKLIQQKLTISFDGVLFGILFKKLMCKVMFWSQYRFGIEVFL